jgi:pentatricopeptide repeat protein
MLSSLVKLGDMQGVEKCFEEWEFDGLSYDIRVPNVLIDAYITKGMIEKAGRRVFLEHVLEKGGKPNFKTWEMFVDGYLENKQMNRAIETMKKAISKVKNREWQHNNQTQFLAPEKAENPREII